MISRGSLFHNETGRRRGVVGALGTALLILGMVWGAAACRDKEQPPAAVTTDAAGNETDCPLVLDTAAWRQFTATCDLIKSGRKPTPQELQAMALTPTGSTWRRSLAPRIPSLIPCGYWVAAAFEDVLGNTMPGKLSKDRRTMATSYRYSYDHRSLIDSLLTRLAEPEILCGLYGRMGAWIDPDSLPPHMVLACLPARPEIRVQADTFLVDTGVLAAGGIEQTLDQTLSLAYRTYQAPRVANPATLTGTAALTEALVLLRNEGVAAFLENRAETYFRRDHPRLKKVVVITQDIAFTAGRILALANTTLPDLLSGPQEDITGTIPFTRSMTASGGYAKLGYAMAATIAGNLGPDRLRTAAPTVAGFFAAYQEAAAKNPVPSPTPGARGYPWYASLRPFDADLYQQLQSLLAEQNL